MKPEETLAILKSEFPNLKWKGGKGNRENVHGFCATFAYGWRFHVEVFPVGCRATLNSGHQIISESPNEQGKTLADAIAVIKSDWTEIASAMNYTLN